MINYLKSEWYRMKRKKSLHITSLICFLLIAGAAWALRMFGKTDPTFPYATAEFYYSNVIGNMTLIMIVSFLINYSLTGRDTAVMKNAVTFGVRRTSIYWSKLLLTFAYFLIISILGVALTSIIGQFVFGPDSDTLRNFLTALVNMAPILLSAFLFIHALKMIKVGDVYVFIVLLFIYKFLGILLKVLTKKADVFKALYDYAPDTLLSGNLMDYMNDAVRFGLEYWVTGAVLSAVAIVIGITKFSKQTID